MKKVIGFIVDVLLLAVAFGATDIIMYKLQSEDWLVELLIFAAFSLVLEGGKWLVSRIFSK